MDAHSEPRPYGQGHLYPKLLHSSEALAAFSSVEHALLDHDWDQCMQLMERIAGCIDEPSLFHPLSRHHLDFARRILDYPFSELMVQDRNLIRQFGARWSYVELVGPSFISPGPWLLERELIAVLLGHDYDIVLDPLQVNAPPHSTSIGERSRYCPLYPGFARLSLAERRWMVFAIHCSFHGEIVDGACLREYLHGRHQSALDRFVEEGYLSGDVGPEDYLCYLPNDTLKSILRGHGVKAKPRKDELVGAVRQAVSPEEIAEYTCHVVRSGDTRLRVPGARKLRQMLNAEKERMWAWGAWLEYGVLADQPSIGCPPFHASNQDSIGKADAADKPFTRDSRSDVDNRDGHNSKVRPVLKFTEDTLTSVAAHPVWSRYWDARCDDIVAELGSRFGWNAFKEAADGIAAYWGPKRLARFEAETRGLKEEMNILGSEGVYNSLLDLYCEARRRQLGVVGPEPTTKSCVECRHAFREDSIPPSLARRCGYHMDFCRECLESTFYRLIYSQRDEQVTSRDEMISRLVALCNALELIPTSTFMKSLKLSPEFSAQKAQRIIRALRRLPLYSSYTQVFGSWLKALIVSGVLSDAVMRTPRGYKTVATDGHECLSLAERTIDEWLYSNNIQHEREPHYPFHPDLNPNEGLRADWRAGSYYVEYFGMLEDMEYYAKAELKAKLAMATRIQLVAVLPGDMLDLDRRLAILLRGKAESG
jgi:hypothetical protein